MIIKLSKLIAIKRKKDIAATREITVLTVEIILRYHLRERANKVITLN